MTRMPHTISREKMIEKAQALADSLYRDSKRSEIGKWKDICAGSASCIRALIAELAATTVPTD